MHMYFNITYFWKYICGSYVMKKKLSFDNVIYRLASIKDCIFVKLSGQVFAKKLHVVRHKTIPGKVNKKGKKTPRKEKVILKLNKEKFALQKRKVDHSSTLDTNNCFPIHKHEIKMLNIKAAKIV